MLHNSKSRNYGAFCKLWNTVVFLNPLNVSFSVSDCNTILLPVNFITWKFSSNLVFLHNINRIVCRTSINNNIFIIRICLTKYRFYGMSDCFTTIVRSCDYTNFHVIKFIIS